MKRHFAASVKKYRKRLDLSQSELAAKCGWSVNDPKAGQSRISNYERGLRTPDLNDIDRLAKALQLDPIELLFPANPNIARRAAAGIDQKLMKELRLINDLEPGDLRALLEIARRLGQRDS